VDIKTRPPKFFPAAWQRIVTNFLFNFRYSVLTWCDIHVNAEATWLLNDNCAFFVLKTGASPLKVGRTMPELWTRARNDLIPRKWDYCAKA